MPLQREIEKKVHERKVNQSLLDLLPGTRIISSSFLRPASMTPTRILALVERLQHPKVRFEGKEEHGSHDKYVH